MMSACDENQRKLLTVHGMIVLSLIMTVQQTTAATAAAHVNVQSCKYNDAHTVANCSFHQLVFVPWHLHKNIITLDLTGNYFPTVANQSFISYSYINHLYLKNNSIKVVEPKAFHTLSFLTTLDLANNKLSHIPSSSLEPIAHTLLQLVLSGNKIQVIPKGIFQNFLRLQLLDLSGNSIFRIEHGAFKGLQSMQELKIRHNALTFLPSDSFDDFPGNVKKIQLYDNRWFCDCKMRWLRQWLNKTNSDVWDSKGYNIRCDGPSLVREKPLFSLSMDELACEVQMKTSSSTRELTKGANTTLLCKYTSVPEAEATWLKNSQTVDVNKHSRKYTVETTILEVHPGEKTQQSELKITDFNNKDIAKYVCYVQNIRGVGSTEYKLTLEGVDFDSMAPASSESQASKSGVDTRSIVIAVGIVCSIILIIVIGVLIICSVNRVQRKRQEKQDAIVENVKQHFINNSEKTVSNGDITGLKDIKLSNKSTENKKLDCTNENDRSASNQVNNFNTPTVKRPQNLDDTEPLYIFEQPESPFSNGNTYVSFGSELTDPSDFPVIPPQNTRAASSRYESSHAGSVTPLLDRNTPSVFDSDEPTEDYAHYPVYDSLTNSIQHPHMEGIYGNGYGYRTGDANSYRTGDANSYRTGDANSYRTGDANSYRTGDANSYRTGNAGKRLSSFYYPAAVNGSMPQTPASTRSTIALSPKNTDLPVNTSSRPDLYRTTPNPNDYRDYREMMYPYATPPPHRVTSATKKSMSVGNLGFTPISSGPRKPPRVFQSREHIELMPQDYNGDYITYPEAHRYSLNYGITPGTPV